MAAQRLIPKTRLPENIQSLAYAAFQNGHHCLMEALAGKREALEGAIISQNVAMLWATPETWPELWLNARFARDEALRLRREYARHIAA